MFNKSVCLLLSGKAGVGKSTSATYLSAQAPKDLSTIVAPFALGVKRVAKDAFGWDGLKDDRGRSLLQRVGQVGRLYNENIWVSRTMDSFLPYKEGFPFDLVLVDDWRFPNEYAYVKQNPLYQTYTLRLVAPELESLKGKPVYNDISETSLDTFEFFDFIIENGGTLEDLYLQLDQILNYIVRENTFGGIK